MIYIYRIYKQFKFDCDTPFDWLKHNLFCLRHYKTLKCIKPIDFAFYVWIFQRHLKSQVILFTLNSKE